MFDTSKPARLRLWSGPAFVLLALASSGAVSLPLSSDAPPVIATLYAEHRVAYVIAQAVGILGVLALVEFVHQLRLRGETSSRAVAVAGVTTALAAGATNVAVLVLCFNTHLSETGIHRAAVATDVTDDILFASFAAFALALAACPLPGWLRAAALLASLLSLGRALAPWAVVPGLEVIAPMTVMSVLFIVGMRIARSGVGGLDDRPGPGKPVDSRWRPAGQ